MASKNTRLNIEKLDENIVQKHGGSKQVGLKQLGSKQVGFKQLGQKQVGFKQLGQKQVGFKQLGPGVETRFHGVSNDDTAMAQTRLEDKQPEEKTNTDCLVKEREKLSSRVPYRDEEDSKTIYPMLADYLGRIRSISDIIPFQDATGRQKYQRKVDIESLDGNVIEFTMWDDLATQFNKKEIEKLPAPIIIAVSSYVQLSATPATYYYINPKTQVAENVYTMFKEKYSLNPPLQVTKYQYDDPEQEKTRNRQTMYTLLQQEPTTFKGVRFTCEAMITSLNNKRSWNYASCSQCSKASVKRNGINTCEDHGEQEPPTYRYNFKATVADGTATA
ncbi:nucleic acid-binding, OB-fold protein [Tanacetum coccineum]